MHVNELACRLDFLEPLTQNMTEEHLEAKSKKGDNERGARTECLNTIIL